MTWCWLEQSISDDSPLFIAQSFFLFIPHFHLLTLLTIYLYLLYVEQWRFGFPIHYILRKQFLYLDLIFDYIFQYDKANFGCKCTHRGRERWETNYFTSKLWTLILFNSYVFFSNYFIMFFCTENYLKML